MIDSEPHPSRTCKTSILFAQLAARVQAGCFAFLFDTMTKPLMRLYFKYKSVLIPKFKYHNVYILPDEILLNRDETCVFSRALSPDSLINLTHLDLSFPMNTLHLGASNRPQTLLLHNLFIPMHCVIVWGTQHCLHACSLGERDLSSFLSLSVVEII